MTDICFEFDPEKSRTNEERHGMGLGEARRLWGAAHVVIPAKDVGGESRYAILGKMDGDVYVAIFTKRGAAVRLISCHRADVRWERIYERCFEEEID